MRLGMVIVCVVWVVAFPCFGHAGDGIRGVDIVGVGDNPSSAVRDGLRQVSEVFGRCFVSSETVVRDFVLEKDVVRGKVEFSGSKLDRFYQGVFRRGGKYVAVFRFPADFIRAVQSRERDKGKSRFSASFDMIQYNSVSADSFGEKSSKGWRFRVPRCIKRFVDFFIWHVDEVGSVEVVREKR